jgi:hypothetical protein
LAPFIEKVGSDALIFLFDTLAPLGEHRLELLFWNCCVLARPISEVLVDALLRESWSFGSTSDPILFAVLIVSGRTSPSAAPPSSARHYASTLPLDDRRWPCVRRRAVCHRRVAPADG